MRGYQKSVIHLKNVDSSVFEEAYFVIKPRLQKQENERKQGKKPIS